LILLREDLPFQRLQMPHLRGAPAKRLANPAAVIIVHKEQVPKHPVPDIPFSPLEQISHVQHQIIPFPLLQRPVAAAGRDNAI
jgi:hypothetical protein